MLHFGLKSIPGRLKLIYSQENGYIFPVFNCGRYTLSTNTDLQEQFTVEVRNRFNALRNDESPTENYQRFIDATSEATEHLMPRIKKNKRSQPSTDPRVEAARTKADKAGSNYHRVSNENNRYKYEQAKKELAGISLLMLRF